MRSERLIALAASLALGLGVAACGDDDNGGGGGNLSGDIKIDGSSTVFPFARAASELFRADNPNVKITVGESGTGGGFEKFCNKETDISDASRPIDPADEVEAPACKKAGVTYTQVQVANDGIAVTTNKGLPIDCMTTDQLKTLWQDDTVTKYNQVDPKLPDKDVSLYGPGTDSGTFEFFNEEINGDKEKSRKKYQPSEDDNQLVQGVSGDQDGLGYFGFSYYEQNTDKLNLVGVDAGEGCKEPSKESVQSGDYKPLSRPLFMYPSGDAIKRPEVKAFMDYVVANQEKIAEQAKIVPMTPEQADKAKQDLSKGEGA